MALPESYTVMKGDTLSEIAEKYYKEAGYSSIYGDNGYLAYLVDLNHIKNANYIIVGQVIKLKGQKDDIKVNTTYTPSIGLFGLVGSKEDSRQVYAEWRLDIQTWEEFEVQWRYYMKVNGKTTTANKGRYERIKTKYDTYTVPDEAIYVEFRVRAISKLRTGSKNQYQWGDSNGCGNWTTWKTFDFQNMPPSTITNLSISINKYDITASVTGIDEATTSMVEFQVFSTDSDTKKYSGSVAVTAGQASKTFSVSAGYDYYFKCRGKRDKVVGNWSDPSAIVGTAPATPKLKSCKASTETAIQLEWEKCNNAETYTIQYTTNEAYFAGSDQVQTIDSVEGTTYLKTGLETGETYFFRMQAKNKNGESGWSEVMSTVLGSGPAAPSTWSSTTTVMVGEELTLYWVHNTEDGSEQTGAKIELEIDGVVGAPISIADDTSFYELDTSSYVEGTTIRWRVCTAALSGDYGDWSVQRRIDVYKPPSQVLKLLDYNKEDLETLAAFPFNISTTVDAGAQKPIGYHLTIVVGQNGESFEATNSLGETVVMKDGDAVYSKYIQGDTLSVDISANDVTLENGYNYTVKCLATMDSGLTCEASEQFTVDWSVDINEYVPNASVSIDEEALTANIQPYLTDIDGNLIPDVLLSVYRRNYDGTFSEIISNVDNSLGTWVTDPHPALDYARYRIIAKYKSTGIIAFEDLAPISIDNKAIVLQWDEETSSYESLTGDDLAISSWSGSMIKLPYNIDVSESFKPDVEAVNYIGREHPVTYYGTQIGETAKWSTVIDKKDTETLYKLRRLAKWMGDVYVREPSGSGYWAHVTVSWNLKHNELTIPISIDVTRVEGGK